MLALLACVPPVSADRNGPDTPDFPYQNQGPFVVAPAKFVSAPFSQIGYMVGEVVCLPVSIAQGPRAHDQEASPVCGKTLGTGVGWPIYAVIGLPFFILKAAFWDAPRAAFQLGRADAAASGSPPPSTSKKASP